MGRAEMPAPRKSESVALATGPQVLVGLAGWSYNDWNGIVYPTPRPRGFHEANVSCGLFRCDRDQHFVLQPLASPISLRNGSSRSRRIRAFSSRTKLWQKFTHEGTAAAEDEKAVRLGFDVSARCEAPGRRVAAIPVFVPSNARQSDAPQVAARHVRGLSAGGRGASCVLGAKEVLRPAARTRGGNLQYRPAADRPLDQAG